MLLRIKLDLGTAFTEVGRFTALGAAAFIELPNVSGSNSELRMTPVPSLWLEDPRRTVAVFRRAGIIDAAIDGRTLHTASEALSPTLLIRRASLVALALDAFTKRRTSPAALQDIRRAAMKELGSDGDWLFDLLHESALEKAIRQAMGFRRGQITRKESPERRLVSSEKPELIETSLGFRILPDNAAWKKAGDVLRKRTVDPRWLIYLPPEMCSIQSESIDLPIEHPKPIFDYYRNEGIQKLVVEMKHMGSRAIVIVCRDETVSKRRFGTEGLGTVYTRNGRPFFEDPAEFLAGLHAGVSKSGFWERFKTDWVCLDGECLPWSLKAEKLIDETHFELLESAEALHRELERVYPLLTGEERESLTLKKHAFSRYRDLLFSYQSQSGIPPSFAPFQIIATEGASHLRRTHLWQMETLRRIVGDVGAPMAPTPYLVVKDDASKRQALTWWDEVSARAEEGFVVKPLYGVPKGRRGYAQPAIKCRTPEHLRLVYGPDYDIVENRWALASRESLKRRRDKHRRVLRQFALSLDAVQEFVDGDHEARTQNSIRSVMSLQPASIL